MKLIKRVTAREIMDSRGNPTLEVDVTLNDTSCGTASVPSGASTGIHEAIEIRDKDLSRFHGKGVLKAVNAVKTEISSLLVGKNAENQTEIDQLLINLDGTANKERLGANAILGTSLAVCKAAAISVKLPLYKFLDQQNHTYSMPVPMMNIINGGCHANNGLDFQEFMIVPQSAKSIMEALRVGSEVFHTLKNILLGLGHSISVGDEGGFAPNLKSSAEALEIIIQAIEQSNYKCGKDVSIALDCASSEYFSNGLYELNGEGLTLNSEQKVKFLSDIVGSYPIISVEDGMSEDDWDGWRKLTAAIGSNCQLVGDDLFATNQARLLKGVNNNIGNAILIKYNQIGTLTETLNVIRAAKLSSYKTIISHRSGETEDTTIADLAVATNSGQIKTGSLSRSDRLAKYNRLIRIEESMGINSPMAKPFC